MNHKDLEVWKKSIELVTEIYNITKSFPKEEQYGIVTQIRRAAVSVPSNIAEGAARYSAKENLRFLDISCGSLAELETQLIISEKLGYVKSGDLLIKIEYIGRLLTGLKKHLKTKINE